MIKSKIFCLFPPFCIFFTSWSPALSHFQQCPEGNKGEIRFSLIFFNNLALNDRRNSLYFPRLFLNNTSPLASCNAMQCNAMQCNAMRIPFHFPNHEKMGGAYCALLGQSPPLGFAECPFRWKLINLHSDENCLLNHDPSHLHFWWLARLAQPSTDTT